MDDSHRYAMLLTALPDHGTLFGAKQTPLSRIRLSQRLALLEPADAACLDSINQCLNWAQQDPSWSDAQSVAHATRHLRDIVNPFARELVIWRLELRTLVAALRQRRRGEPAPSGYRWGVGRWLGPIRRQWDDPTFRLEGVFPWLPEANRLLERGDAVGLERLLLDAVWRHLGRLSDGHYFDFEAVIIYVMRWDLVARWTSHDGEAAVERFDALVSNEPLALNDDLFAQAS